MLSWSLPYESHDDTQKTDDYTLRPTETMSRKHPWERLSFWRGSQPPQVNDVGRSRRAASDDIIAAVNYPVEYVQSQVLHQTYAPMQPRDIQPLVPVSL